jgi:rod shape-determining protein MreC
MLVLLVITSLALMSLDERGSGLINSARTAAQDVVSPLQDLADDAINPAADWFDGLGRANELQDENTKLRQQLADAQSKVAAAAATQAQLQTYRQMFDLPDVADGDAVVAEVAGQGAGNFSRSYVLSKGSNAGIKLGQPVVVGTKGASALVGRVVRVSKDESIVQRIDDANFGVGAQLVQSDGNGPKGTAEGQRASNLLRFSVIDASANTQPIKKGQVVMTLGALGEPFPAGLAIGTVVHEVAAGGAIARDAELHPIVDLGSITVVKVLNYPPEPTP